ncbi:hypothetical protein STOPSMEL_15 [Sinorhizobium phage StopSmel]|nr:hypothetical protein STOPSMEL_15 [Sinorhizobium phage StopSmel]
MATMNRETLRRRINALKQMTRERGCTEAEAMAAAAKIAELLQDHGLSEEQLEMCSGSADVSSRGDAARARLWSIIAHCTNTSSIVITTVVPKGSRVEFFGREPGPDIAVYLMSICARAIATETANFKRGSFFKRRRTLSTKRAAVADFVAGLAARLGQRLLKLFDGVVSEDALVAAAAARDEAFPTAETFERKPRKSRFDGASDAGWIAGGNVNLTHGVAGANSDPLMLGVRP